MSRNFTLPEIVYFCVDGIKRIGNNNSIPAFYKDVGGQWHISDYDIHYASDGSCIPIHEAIRMATFTRSEYEDARRFVVSPIIYDAGIGPDSPFSKDDFERFVSLDMSEKSLLFKALYWQDYCGLVSNIQTAQIEIIAMAGEFYKLLAEYEFTGLPDSLKCGIRRTDSPDTRMATSLLYMTFVRMHSILDYSVKLCKEAEAPTPSFTNYPRLKGLNDQFGEKKKLKLNGMVGTVFEDCTFIRKIESIRNRVIHDGHLSPNQWIYERYDGGRTAERFVLFPDMTVNPGSFDRSGNRRSFYGLETKINLDLPAILREFFDRCAVTLNEVRQLIEAKRIW